MSFFNDDKDKDNFFSPVSFTSASDKTSSWAYESNSTPTNSAFSEPQTKGGFDPYSTTSLNAANDTKSSGNFFSNSSDAKNSAFGGYGYNSHSKDQDVFSLTQHLEHESRFDHWTPQDSFMTAENAKSNLEDKDWKDRYGGSSWAYEKEKDNSSWAFNTQEHKESDWGFKIPSTDSSNWAFSQSKDSSSNWAYNQPSLNRWGFDSNSKESASDDFDLFGKKKG